LYFFFKVPYEITVKTGDMPDADAWCSCMVKMEQQKKLIYKSGFEMILKGEKQIVLKKP
jgi:hypothetical protein